jgi:hypothetical protein
MMKRAVLYPMLTLAAMVVAGCDSGSTPSEETAKTDGAAPAPPAVSKGGKTVKEKKPPAKPTGSGIPKRSPNL